MKTKLLIQMDICIPAATFKVISIEPFESMLLIREQMKCTFLGSILAFERGRPRGSHSKAMLSDSHNIAVGMTFVETGVSTRASARSFGGFITGLSLSSFIRAIRAVGFRIASFLLCLSSVL